MGPGVVAPRGYLLSSHLKNIAADYVNKVAEKEGTDNE